MTLRLRLTLFYTALVAIILVASGFTLHGLFQRSLQTSFDQGMLETSQIILSTFENEEYEIEEGELELHIDPRTFPNEQTAIIFNSDGEVQATLGGRIDNINEFLKNAPTGFSSNGTFRILSTQFTDFSIILLKSTNPIQQTLRAFDRLFIILIPIALLISFILGYFLSKQALRPVDKLTKAAYDIANRRAWRESLPEPKVKDELWRLSAATNSLLASLKDVIETERRFTADAAHELRTPITVLQGRLEQVMESTKESKNRSRLLKAHNASEKLLSLVEKLLILARTEAGQGLEKDKLALDELAFHTAENLKPLFDKKDIKLLVNVPDDPVYIQGDPMALELLTRNLLENALKFTQEGSVTLSVKEEKGQAFMQITDTGPGIPEKAIDKLFDRFYQTQVSHRQQGSGLGLALVKSISDWHGGSLDVSNQPQGGSQFSLRLNTI